MTTIVYRDGVIAADSWSTLTSEAGGARRHVCTKLDRKRIKGREVILTAAGEVGPALIFFDWYGSAKPVPDIAQVQIGDFHALIVEPDGLYEADGYFRPWRVVEADSLGFYAVGSGSKAALGALHMGADAREAVRIAALVDPYTGGDIVSMSLRQRVRRRRELETRQDRRRKRTGDG